ncbi:hypothetical protein TNCV_4854701 [Trichonephila clavipes]|nr:hypothetical protein TNCV_4854701 [Trichonephila clavipes]
MVVCDHTPQDNKRPQSMRRYRCPHHRPPSCFMIGTMQSTGNTSAGVRQTNTRQVVQNNVNEDSSDQMTRPHCSCVQLRGSRRYCSMFIQRLN